MGFGKEQEIVERVGGDEYKRARHGDVDDRQIAPTYNCVQNCLTV